ncbi:hypothetical protein ASPWEDRAFT_35673 [Aspergillus wentii DTO 134E9]|uniref:Enoyl reductase (ER) domain-containing protein n=1 Tax=Aspergillus wentii DTO 134E9 TaxID=1073089 RepID=A0A1L9RT60_ASPWE|nr:uncharacterized protein ASPWEDRAFT_35673 [Aspergillus wentii DTO 134E9]OJJ38109.1 hypothetical protein ASPWEDRAFT_35673 [Aspergillus wentii DTO 134E9]
MRVLIQPTPTSPHLHLIDCPIPSPNPNANEHLIRVHCTAPTAGELLWSTMVAVPDKQPVPCSDMAGTVVSAPPDSPFQAGDEVYARTSFSRPGAAREYTIALTEELAHRPKGLSWAEAASIPLCAETAWQALFEQAGVGDFHSPVWKGKRVLVTGASGGTGNWVVQLGKIVGAEVIGTCGSKNVDFVRGLGAAEAIDYRKQSLREWTDATEKKVDVVIDCVGGKTLEDAWWCVANDGVVVSICHPPEEHRPVHLLYDGIKEVFFIMKPDGSTLQKITKLVEEGKCWPVVDSVWSLQQFQEAFDRVGGGHARGKVIMDLTI